VVRAVDQFSCPEVLVRGVRLAGLAHVHSARRQPERPPPSWIAARARMPTLPAGCCPRAPRPLRRCRSREGIADDRSVPIQSAPHPVWASPWPWRTRNRTQDRRSGRLWWQAGFEDRGKRLGHLGRFWPPGG
jgi:hypothetical protein